LSQTANLLGYALLVSVGHLRQQVDLIGYALLVNGLTMLRRERRGRLPSAA